MDATGWMILLLLIGMGLMFQDRGRKLWVRWQRFQAWERGELAAPSPVSQPAAPPADELLAADLTVLPGAGRALANPPGVLRAALAEMHRSAPKGEYTIPLGWVATKERAAILHAALVNDVNHILVTGTTDVGKDNLVLNMLFALTDRYGPDKLQLAIVDGKSGLSWNGWHTKAHTWLFARKSKDILPAMEALTKERERREEILWNAKVEKWEQYTGPDMPLLVVFISELLLLQSATSRSALAQWMNDELSSARSSGIRYIVATQTVTNFDTTWRSNISLLCAGYQTLNSADEPNSTFTTKALRELGTQPDGTVTALPPSDLPAPSKNAPNKGGCGVFTCVQGRTVYTVRAGLLPDDERRARLAAMPDDPKKLADIQKAKHEADLAANPLLAALINQEPLPFEAAVPVAVTVAEPTKETRLADLLKGRSFPELEKEPLFVSTAVDVYRRAGSVRQTVIEIFGGYTGSRDQLVSRILRASGELPDRASTPAVSAA